MVFAGVAALYSRDFYTLAKSRLQPGGYLTQWRPAYQVPADMTMSLVRAFVDVFPQAVLLSGMNAELILMGVNGSANEIDPERVRARLAAAPAVQADLDRVSLGTLLEIIGTFVAPAQTLIAAVEPYPPVTDDSPILEYAILSQSGQLKIHELPSSLIDPAGVTRWCPKCFSPDGPSVVWKIFRPTWK